MKKAILVLMLLVLPLTTQARVKAEEELVSMGEFKITAYCSCEECSDGWGLRTSTGTHCEEGRTIAVDPSVIAYGTRVKIGDNVFVAEDCGGAVVGDTIDIYLDDHDRVEKFGVKHRKVWLVK